MRILQVITSLQTGGAERLITDIVPLLRERGHCVDVALFDGRDTMFKKELQACGCKIYSLSSGGSVYHVKLLFRLRRLLHSYELVHTHNTSPQFFGALASFGLKIRRITTEHSSNNRRRAKPFFKPIDRWMYRRYERIISISDVAENNLKNYLQEDDCRFVTIQNGVNLSRFREALHQPSLRSGSDRCIVVMVAGFRYEKDQDTLIKAMSLLPPDQFELWLVGDGVRRPILEQLVNQYGVRDRVLFWGIRSDVPEILHTADIVVMSSHFEGLSLSSIEGMSVEKPFVASNVDGLREVTEGAGILFDHQDYVHLAEILKNLHDNSILYKKTAEACMKRASDYDISKTVDQYERLYLK